MLLCRNVVFFGLRIVRQYILHTAFRRCKHRNKRACARGIRVTLFSLFRVSSTLFQNSQKTTTTVAGDRGKNRCVALAQFYRSRSLNKVTIPEGVAHTHPHGVDACRCSIDKFNHLGVLLRYAAADRNRYRLRSVVNRVAPSVHIRKPILIERHIDICLDYACLVGESVRNR